MPFVHEVFQQCSLQQQTQTNHLWVPRKGLAFVRSNDVIYGGRGFSILFLYMLDLDTIDHCLRLKLRTSMTRALVSILEAFVEVWRFFIVFCSGGLAYT